MASVLAADAAYPCSRFGATAQAYDRNKRSSRTRRSESPPCRAMLEETITVIGIRAGDKVPVTKTNLDREQIDTLNYGQDVPQLLQYTPAMTWYSDSGVGSNYSVLQHARHPADPHQHDLRRRPSQRPGRARCLLQQFPRLHEHGGQHPDSAWRRHFVGRLALLRRIGELRHSPPAQDRSGDLRLALGSYDTKRASFGYESGVFENGVSVGGRFSYADTDGYRDNSGTKHQTGFIDAGWQGERSSLKLVSFLGEVETQLAWLAVEPEILAENRRFNPLDEEERDTFGQNFAQLKYACLAH